MSCVVIVCCVFWFLDVLVLHGGLCEEDKLIFATRADDIKLEVKCTL
jgi:hypothetical protein